MPGTQTSSHARDDEERDFEEPRIDEDDLDDVDDALPPACLDAYEYDDEVTEYIDLDDLFAMEGPDA
jgi:hypothetical protein